MPSERMPVGLHNGDLAVLAEGPFENLQINIAVEKNPKSQDDFHVLVHDIDLQGAGHFCVPLPKNIPGVQDETTATLQLMYKGKINQSDPDSKMKYLFQCADVRFVSHFEAPTMLSKLCFNGTAGGNVTEGDRKSTITTQKDLEVEKEKLESSSDAVSWNFEHSAAKMAGIVLLTQLVFMYNLI